MRVFSLNTVALALVVLSLAVPTGAVFGDHVGGENGIVLSPHNGPNGKYASINGSGDLTIDLGDEVNTNAVTEYDDVFDITNNGSDHVRVWITHNATEHVLFRTDGAGSILGEENGTVIGPGSTVVVGLTVDTDGASRGTDLIDEMSIHARPVDPPETSAPSGGSGGSSGGFVSAPTSTPLETQNDTVVVSGTVRIAFDRDVRPDDTVRVDREAELPQSQTSFGIRPSITRTGSESQDTAADQAARLEAIGADGIARPGEPVVLTGTQTLLDSPTAINPDGSAVAVYDITVSPRLRDSGATLWMTVNRTRFEGLDPSGARVARQHGDGWHLLQTSLESANASHVVLRARTPGFSRFAVLPRSEVTYRWSVEDRGQIEAEDVLFTYDEPGIYTVGLTVSDGLGRQNVTDYRLLVNDRPAVEIVRPEPIEPGEPVTLQADVTDRYGETNVTWHFDDGIEAEGREVNRSFTSGEHVVTVDARDEFGANTTVEERFVVGEREPVARVVQFALGLQSRLASIALASLVVIGIVRWLVDRYRWTRRRRRR